MPLFLILIALALIILNLTAIKKEKKSFREILENKNENIQDFEIELGRFRKEVAETLLDIQKEIEDIKSYIDSSKVEPINSDEEDKFNSNEEISVLLGNGDYNAAEDQNEKVKAVVELLSLGKNIDEICEELNLGKGEVLLIKELYKK